MQSVWLRGLIVAVVLSALPMAAETQAQLTVPAQNWDGSLVVSSDTTLDLSEAATGDWDTLPTGAGWSAGEGVYDASQWAVVYHYTDVTIDASASLDFAPHPSGAPVVWIVSGNVNIAGTLDLSGKPSSGLAYVRDGGPGGFRGGNGYSIGVPESSGFGPGGSTATYGYDASYATEGDGGAPTYGNDSLIPLIGGSGGCGNYGSGGGGGGAILIVAAGNVQVDGSIYARGGAASGPGAGNGSGGAIRIVAPQIQGTGSLLATGGGLGAGEGRIRLEYTDQIPSVDEILPAASIADLGSSAVAQLWPAANDPLLRIVSFNGIPVPADPEATMAFPWQDVALDGGNGDVTVVLEGTFVPVNATVNVFLTRIGGGGVSPTPASLTSSVGDVTTWELTLQGIDNGISAIQARAVLP